MDRSVTTSICTGAGMKRLFLDTSYLIALEAADDQHHGAAVAHWRTLGESLPLLVTSTYIFDEVTTFFAGRGRHAKAVEIGERLLASASVDVLHVDESLFPEAWSCFSRFRGQVVFLHRLCFVCADETAWDSSGSDIRQAFWTGGI